MSPNSGTTVVHGTDAPVTTALAAVAKSPQLGELILELLAAGWRRSGMPAQDLEDILAAVAVAPDSRSALTAVHTQAPYLVAPESDFATSYRAARARKFHSFAAVIGPQVAPGSVVDVGAGGTQLVRCLADLATSASTYVATDVAGVPENAGSVRFVVQEQADRLPVGDNAATTMLATGMLHHVATGDRDMLLAEVWRCLAPGGRLVLIEDTFPSRPWQPVDDADARFLSLSPQDRMHLLAWTDWWGNRVLKNLPDEPLPCTFLTMEEWTEELGRHGFDLVVAEYLGLWDAGGHMATPRALIVCERPR